MKISTSLVQRIDGRLTAAQTDGADQGQTARALLHQIAVDLIDKRGTIKSGYLKVAKADGQNLRVGTRWSKAADASTRDALNLVQSLVREGYGDKPAVEASLRQYLQASGGDHLGTHSFVKLVRTLEDASERARPAGDRLNAARVKAGARLDTSGFADAFLQQESERRDVLLEDVMEPPVAPAQGHSGPVVPPDAGRNSQQFLSQAAQVAVQDVAVVGEIPSAARPAAIPVAAPVDPRQTALIALQYGRRADAVRALQKIEGALQPQALAQFLVQDRLQGRAISTQMVLMAEAAYARDRPVALDDVASFLFAGVTLAHQEALQDPSFDAGLSLSGLLDVAMLWKARRPAEAAGLAEKLADLVSESLPNNESASALCQRLNAIGTSEPIKLDEIAGDQSERFQEVMEELELSDLNDLDEAARVRTSIRSYLDQAQEKYPQDASLGQKVEALKNLLENHEALASSVQAREDGGESRKLRKITADIKRAMKVFVAEVAGKGQPTLEERVQDQVSKAGHFMIRAQFEDGDHRTLRQSDLQLIETKASSLGAIAQGSTLSRVAVGRAQNSYFDQCYAQISARNTVRRGTPVDLQRSIFSGVATFELNLNGSNLSGSVLSFIFDNYDGADLQRVKFVNSNLDDAQIEIDYSEIESRLVDLRKQDNPQRKIEAYLVSLMNHFDRPTRSGLFTMIASIDDRYAQVKVPLMRQAMELLAREHCIEALAPALVDVLSKSPMFLADARIRELAGPLLPAILDTLGRAENLPSASVLARLLVELLSSADSASAQAMLRSYIGQMNAFLHRVEDNPSAFDASVQADAQTLRARLHDLPEIKSLLPTLDGLYLEHTRADGQVVPMPYYFELGNDGAVAALDAAHYQSVVRADPGAKLIEDTVFFVPPAQRYGQVNESYYPVEGSPLVMLAPANIKDRGLALLGQFPMLHKAYLSRLMGSRILPLQLLETVFAGDTKANTRQMLAEAFNGLSRRLNAEQVVELEMQFAEYVPQMFSNAAEAGDNVAKWPDLQFSPAFLQALRDQADSVGIARDDPRGFASFLFMQSAVLTRLSSEKVFGDGDHSIPSLRMLGYALFKEALKIDPSFIKQDLAQNMEDRFLKRNSAFDCAEILSRMQLKASRQVNPEAFEFLTPAVFKGASM